MFPQAFEAWRVAQSGPRQWDLRDVMQDSPPSQRSPCYRISIKDGDALWAMVEMRVNFGAPLTLAAGRWAALHACPWTERVLTSEVECRGAVVVAGPLQREEAERGRS
jgi:hypothetical protein